MKQQKKHKWCENDDIIALYLTLHGSELLGTSRAKVSEKMGIKDGSMKMRISNFNGKFEHIAKQSINVFQKYEKLSEPELRSIVIGILARN